MTSVSQIPLFPSFWRSYEPKAVTAPVTTNSQRLDGLVHNGKIYLSLADAIVLGLENNYDIAIQRYNLDIADTDLLRARAGSNLLGVSAGLVEGTLGGSGTSSTSLSSGGGPGGTSTAVGGAGAGAGGLNVTTNGTGPTPEAMDPALTGTVQLERTTTPEATPFASGAPTLNQNTDQYNFSFQPGFHHRHPTSGWLQQQPHYQQQYLQCVQSGVAVHLPGHRDATFVERFWSGDQWPLHPRSQE